MRRFLIATAAAAILLAGPVVRAQAPSQAPITPPQSTVNLTVEQRHTIKELVQDLHVQQASGNFPVEVGKTVPDGVHTTPIPVEIAEKVPQVKSHVFFVMNDHIVLVSPKDNKIADVIE